MLKMFVKKELLISLAILLFPNFSGAAIIFQDKFDNSPDWTSKQSIYPTNRIWPSTWAVEDGGMCTTYCPPKNWSTYRGVGSQLSNGAPGHDTYSVSSEGARGGSGRGFTYWHEVLVGKWADGAGLEKYIRNNENGYPELYLRYWEKWSPDAQWNDGAIHKELDFYSNQTVPTVTNNFDTRLDDYAWGSPSFIPQWYGNYGKVYLQEMLRQAPRFDAYSYSGTANSVTEINWPTDSQWHSYEWRIKLNSAPGSTDGIVEFWLDGVKQNAACDYGVPFVMSIPWQARTNYGDTRNNPITPTNQLKGYRVIGISGDGKFHVVSNVNDKLVMRYDASGQHSGTWSTVSVPVGDYTGATIAQELATQLSAHFGAVFSAEWNSVTRFFKITSPVGSTLDVRNSNPDTGEVSSANTALGFSVTSTINSSLNILSSGRKAGGQSGEIEPNWLVDCPNKGDTCQDGELTWENYTNFGWTQFAIHDNFYHKTGTEAEFAVYVDDVVVSDSYVGPAYVIPDGSDLLSPASPTGMNVW